MADVNFLVLGKKIREDILNWRDIEIEVSFQNDSPVATVRTGNLEFVGEAFTLLDEWVKAGTAAGPGVVKTPGIYEAPSFEMLACNRTVLLGGVDLADCGTSFQCNQITAPIKETNKIDFLNDRANSFSFAYLASLPAGKPGRITEADYIKVPYVINSIPNFSEIMIAVISIYVVVKELKEAIEATAKLIAELAGDAIPTVGTGATIAVGALVADIIKVVLYLVYIGFMIIALINLLELIVLNLIQPIKYKKGIKVSTLFTRACEYLGLTFTSTILNSSEFKNLVIIPKKTALLGNTKTNHSMFGNFGNFDLKQYDDVTQSGTYGYFEGTFSDLIRALNPVFNAEIRVINNTVNWHRVNYFSYQSNVVLPALNYEPYQTNACELAANYLLIYALDEQDTNTYDQYDGQSCQMTLTPTITVNKGNILLKNLTEKRLAFARAKRKETLNAIEQIASALYDVVKEIYDFVVAFINTVKDVINTIISLLNAIFPGADIPPIPPTDPFPPNPFLARIGMMLLSNDFIGVQKLLVVENSPNTGAGVPANSFNVKDNNATLTSAAFLIDKYHFVNFAIYIKKTNGTNVVPTFEHNQYFIFKDKQIPLCCADFVKLLNLNYILTHDQKAGRVDSLVWNPFKEEARITFRVKELYLNNLTNNYVIDGQ